MPRRNEMDGLLGPVHCAGVDQIADFMLSSQPTVVVILREPKEISMAGVASRYSFSAIAVWFVQRLKSGA